MCIKCVLVFVSALFPPSFFSFESGLCIPLLFWWIFSPQSLCFFFLIFRHPLFITWLLQKSPRKETGIKARTIRPKNWRKCFFYGKKNHPPPRNCADQCAINEILDLLTFSSFSPPTTNAHQSMDVLNHGQFVIFRIIIIFAKILSGSELRLAKKKPHPPGGFGEEPRRYGLHAGIRHWTPC